MIDWTQPVIDARDMDADPLFDSQGRVQACRIGSVVYAPPAFEKLGLRNVAPPKPEPVLMERWVNLYPSRMSSGFETEDRATAVADTHDGGRVECRRIAWMSDGSPVPGEGHTNCWANYSLMLEDRDAWKSKAEALQAEVTALSSAGMIVQLKAEVERMRPLYNMVMNTLSNSVKINDAVRSVMTKEKTND